MTRILVVDDDESFGQLVALHLAGEHQVDRASSAEQGLARLERTVYDVVLTDLHMPPGLDGIEFLRRARQREVDAPFILLTAQATIETAVASMREGAFDYQRKNSSGDEIRAAVRRAIDHGRMARELSRLRGDGEPTAGAPSRGPIGQSERFKSVMALAEKVAVSDASVLILGESGTGKELLARAIHRWSPRARGPFVAFDCSALAPSLVESELFGHEKGAFTGAQKARRGLFREASGGGSLFLDEIGDIAPEVQNKLLRVLQEREVKPVGGDSFLKIDVRVIAATNKDLKKLAAEGRFREDLYYRLAVVPIEIPPLRERRDDVPLLVEHFLRRPRGGAARPTRITTGALAKLEAYRWPGNIRELENVVERAAILSDGVEISERDLPPLGDPPAPAGAASASTGLVPRLAGMGTRPLKELLDEAVGQVEREAIVEALRAEAGSASRAARRLGISRAALYNKVKRHNIVL